MWKRMLGDFGVLALALGVMTGLHHFWLGTGMNLYFHAVVILLAAGLGMVIQVFAGKE